MKKEGTNILSKVAITSEITAGLVGPIIFGIFTGRWLDEQISTKPLFLIIGIISGFACGFYVTYKLIKHYQLGE